METKIFLNRNVRTFAVCSAAMRDWKHFVHEHVLSWGFVGSRTPPTICK
jgi:hypothetical protein